MSVLSADPAVISGQLSSASLSELALSAHSITPTRKIPMASDHKSQEANERKKEIKNDNNSQDNTKTISPSKQSTPMIRAARGNYFQRRIKHFEVEQALVLLLLQ